MNKTSGVHYRSDGDPRSPYLIAYPCRNLSLLFLTDNFQFLLFTWFTSFIFRKLSFLVMLCEFLIFWTLSFAITFVQSGVISFPFRPTCFFACRYLFLISILRYFRSIPFPFSHDDLNSLSTKMECFDSQVINMHSCPGRSHIKLKIITCTRNNFFFYYQK